MTAAGKARSRDEALTDAIPALVLGFDAEGKIVVWNRLLEALTGFSAKEVLGGEVRTWVGRGGDRRLDVKGGGHRLVRWQISSDAQDGISYAIGVDVTQERDELRATLQSERLAAVGTLAAGLAHEVRNPLNSGSLQLQVLRRRIERGQTDREQLLPVIDIVSAEIERVERLVHDLLAFAQPRRLALVTTSLNELVAELGAQIEQQARAAGVTVRLTLAPTLGTVHVEPELIRQVLSNLLRNALEAMPSGGTLTVRTLAADARGFVRVDIQDTGVGFSEDARLFDAFYTTKPSGSGLGLAVAHKIVSDHGGYLSAEPCHPGACFSVKLPQLGKAGVLDAEPDAG